MEDLRETFELKIAAHRVLLASLLAKLAGTDEELESLREQVLDGNLAALVRIRYPGTGDAFFEEMEHVLLLAHLAAERVEERRRAGNEE
ncbi:hypothetical protein [Paraburkholderia lycopersici]|uniref:Uncharacterized protein n=1 Tax=Paraburkholderia lycopersici TaxID=416944 RepID=A0A1G6HEB5_9BURK|nr:hypothetical protein [Paraburkholderia lycopersici]SDB92600.1 hypothetical protein SAMN05421548_102232 [Paraburkholderia lycopersici]